MSSPVFIDSDNAMGSRSGDVDDAFAIAALLRSGQSIVALSSVFGNTAEALAHANNSSLARLLRFDGLLLRGAAAVSSLPTDASQFLAAAVVPLRIAALGPLTNIAAAITAGASRCIEELVVIGSNSISRGRWPPVWPYEFNLTKDRHATKICFDSTIPMTVFPLNVASGFRFDRAHLHQMEGPLGDVLRQGTERWLRHLFWTRAMREFPIYDLLAALYMTDPEGVDFEERNVSISPSGFIDYRGGDRMIRVATRFSKELLWRRFLRLLREADR
ncbi:MAG TPA: nucleoside hydrolase [Thermoanaerobaculia bacterium]|nr:nucleoside hydrolase [Thermoanaerobaculia bacterium]